MNKIEILEEYNGRIEELEILEIIAINLESRQIEDN